MYLKVIQKVSPTLENLILQELENLTRKELSPKTVLGLAPGLVRLQNLSSFTVWSYLPSCKETLTLDAPSFQFGQFISPLYLFIFVNIKVMLTLGF